MSLNVLVFESEPGAADESRRELIDAGHAVLSCHDSGQPAFPCRGLSDDATCPLRAGTVDVAITVRPSPRPQPAPTEDGVQCALMARVPLVVAGSAAPGPFDGFATRSLSRTHDVVSTCEAAASAELPVHARVALISLAQSVGAERASSAGVSVTRRSGELDVRIAGLTGVTHQERQTAVVRIVGALREFDRAARTIDVSMVDAI